MRFGRHRIASAEGPADVVRFVASHASRLMSEQKILVDGSLSINGNVGHAAAESEFGG